jgi:phosphoribosylanthranilate isomerase
MHDDIDVFLKVCGITRESDAQHAVRHGADAIGFVFWPDSPRFVGTEAAAAIVARLPANVRSIGVFVNEEPVLVREIAGRVGLHAVQLHGDETPAYAAALDLPVMRAVTLATIDRARGEWPEQTMFLLDAADPVQRGGTGRRVDWNRAARAINGARVVLAGGLTPDNVAEAIATVRPFGVDVSSGVEQEPGMKDVDKVSRFLERARAAFEALGRQDGGR